MTSPPRTRQRLSRAEREQQIIEAAMRVIAADGYNAGSLELIAETAGVSKGLVSHYFSGRDDLMRRTAERALADLRLAVARHLDPDDPAPAQVRAAILAAADLPREHAVQWRSLNQIVLNLRGPDGRQQATLHDYEATYLSQEQMFRRGQEAGDFRADLDPRVVAVTYQGAVDAMLAYLDCYPETDVHRFATQVADLFLQGLGPDGGLRPR